MTLPMGLNMTSSSENKVITSDAKDTTHANPNPNNAVPGAAADNSANGAAAVVNGFKHDSVNGIIISGTVDNSVNGAVNGSNDVVNGTEDASTAVDSTVGTSANRAAEDNGIKHGTSR